MKATTNNYKNGFYLSSKEVAKIFGVKEATVRRWAIEGQVIAHKIGKQWFFARTKVFEWQGLKDTKEVLGNDSVEFTGAKFDVFLDGKRVEVKTAPLSEVRGFAGVRKSWNFKINKLEDSDFHLLLGYDKKRENLLKAFYMSTKFIYEIKKSNKRSLGIPYPSPFFERYAVKKIQTVKVENQ